MKKLQLEFYAIVKEFVSSRFLLEACGIRRYYFKICG